MISLIWKKSRGNYKLRHQDPQLLQCQKGKYPEVSWYVVGKGFASIEQPKKDNIVYMRNKRTQYL
jgi:hypothetical protein